MSAAEALRVPLDVTGYGVSERIARSGSGEPAPQILSIDGVYEGSLRADAAFLRDQEAGTMFWRLIANGPPDATVVVRYVRAGA